MTIEAFEVDVSLCRVATHEMGLALGTNRLSFSRAAQQAVTDRSLSRLGLLNKCQDFETGVGWIRAVMPAHTGSDLS